MLLLEDCEVGPEVVGGVVLNRLGHILEQLLDSGFVVFDGLGRTAFHQLGG